MALTFVDVRLGFSDRAAVVVAGGLSHIKELETRLTLHEHDDDDDDDDDNEDLLFQPRLRLIDSSQAKHIRLNWELTDNIS